MIELGGAANAVDECPRCGGVVGVDTCEDCLWQPDHRCVRDDDGPCSCGPSEAAAMSDKPDDAVANAYRASLDRVGAFLAECEKATHRRDRIRHCHDHPVTVGDLWTLYCAHRDGTHRA